MVSNILMAIVADTMNECTMIERWKNDTARLIESGVVNEVSMTKFIRNGFHKPIVGEPVIQDD